MSNRGKMKSYILVTSLCITFTALFYTSNVSAQIDIPTWHIQYNPTPTNPVTDVEYWNLDLFDISGSAISDLQSNGVFVICYFSAGSWENWRPDADQFPENVLGRKNGWPGEKWLDIRSQIVRDIMKNRIDLGISKGCDGFDPDNMDGYSAKTGFPLTKQDSIDYYSFLANYIHSQNKKVGLKNALEILPGLLPKMNWAVNEECYRYKECSILEQVISDGKPVFHIEYGDTRTANNVCHQSNASGFTTLIKKEELDEFEISCRSWSVICGNGVIEEGEQCDDGNTNSGDGCSSTCQQEFICGNGIVEVSEECDDGNSKDNDSCTNSCTIATCGDGTIYTDLEDCDDGNINNNDTCTNDCALTFCGDNTTQSPNGQETNEVCDGNDNSCTTPDSYQGIATCETDCLLYTEQCTTTEFCGDLITNGNEECDDGPDGSSTCTSDCTLTSPPASQIIYDGFESNSWNGGAGNWNFEWYHDGDASIQSSDQPHSGAYHLRLRQNNGYVDRQADLSRLNSATLSFYAKVSNFEGSDFADVLIKGKGKWKVVKTFTAADSDNAYHYYEFDLPQRTLTNKSWIAIDTEMSSTDDELYIDEIKITSP